MYVCMYFQCHGVNSPESAFLSLLQPFTVIAHSSGSRYSYTYIHICMYVRKYMCCLPQSHAVMYAHTTVSNVQSHCKVIMIGVHIVYMEQIVR